MQKAVMLKMPLTIEVRFPGSTMTPKPSKQLGMRLQLVGGWMGGGGGLGLLIKKLKSSVPLWNVLQVASCPDVDMYFGKTSNGAQQRSTLWSLEGNVNEKN